jgi:hypothetical protein
VVAVVGRAGFAGLVDLVGLSGRVGLDGFLAFGDVGFLVEVREGFLVGPFLLGVPVFLAGFEDMDDFFGDFFFIFISFILVALCNR